MKQILLSLVILVGGLAGAAGAASPESFYRTLDQYDRLLANYAAPEGVRYDAWRDHAEDRAALDLVVQRLEAVDPSSLEEADRYALYINLYNASTLRLVIEGNPKQSIRDLSKMTLGFGVFHAKRVLFDGEKISLDTLEDRLRAESQDPRVHFAVNCASYSCPALLEESFRGDRLDEQLEQQSFAFLERDDALAVDGKRVQLSKIFDWYADDFGGADGVLQFVQRYAPKMYADSLADLSKLRVKHFDYDWDLNRVE